MIQDHFHGPVYPMDTPGLYLSTLYVEAVKTKPNRWAMVIKLPPYVSTRAYAEDIAHHVEEALQDYLDRPDHPTAA